jgi:hypothetical protein
MRTPTIIAPLLASRTGLYDQLDGFEPPLTGGVVAVAYTHEVLAILGQQLFRAFLARLQGHLSAHAPNLHGPGNPIATDGAKPWIHGMRSSRVMLGRYCDLLVGHHER